MKAAKFIGMIFAVAGIVLMLGSYVICFASINSSVKILEYPDGAAECFEDFAQAVQTGNYSAMGQLVYGQPDFDTDSQPDNLHTALVWNTFRDNIRFEYTGNPYLQDSALTRDAVLSVPDVASILEKLDGKVRSVLSAKVAAAEDPISLYDTQGNFQAQVVEEALQEALEQLLLTELTYKNENVTVRLIRQDDRWWILPDPALTETLTGFGA